MGSQLAKMQSGMRKVVSDVVEVASRARAQAILRGVPVDLVFFPIERRVQIEAHAGGASAAPMRGGAVAEALLFAAARAEHVHRTVRPALERVLATSGRAMVIAALTLAAGMVPLLFCRLGPLRTFAALTIFEILAALVADFFILPSVLACFAGDVSEGVSDAGGSRDPPGSTPAA